MKYPKVVKKTKGAAPQQQYAALPWRRKGKALEIMLITSRETRRWVIPKGWPMKGRKSHATAALEAIQEAGLLGKIDKTTIGAFHYQKKLGNGATVLCRVDVFPLRVVRQRKNWPEKRQRATKWFSASKAARMVDEPELTKMIRGFEKLATKSFKKATAT
ncbi:NUDIX hydrolase [Methylocystis sp. IM3]|uniref:NUDIX hydrolase n=1 Tax=unclassified Methylocystis TaxID=2625913 RepID=UPI0030F74ECA